MAYRSLSKAQPLVRVPVDQPSENVHLSLLKLCDRVRRVGSEVDQILCQVRNPGEQTSFAGAYVVGCKQPQRQTHKRGMRDFSANSCVVCVVAKRSMTETERGGLWISQNLVTPLNRWKIKLIQRMTPGVNRLGSPRGHALVNHKVPNFRAVPSSEGKPTIGLHQTNHANPFGT